MQTNNTYLFFYHECIEQTIVVIIKGTYWIIRHDYIKNIQNYLV